MKNAVEWNWTSSSSRGRKKQEVSVGELWELLNGKLGGQGAKVSLRWGRAFKSAVNLYL